MADADVEAPALTLERAAAEYFDAAAKKLEQRQRVAVTRFVSWSGPSRVIGAITAHEITQFQDGQGQHVADLSERLVPLKAFFTYARRRGWTATNLGVHLRVKRPQRRPGAAGVQEETEPAETIEMTPEGLKAATGELERLKGERPGMAAQLEAAMADKDFRENAPLDAARDAQGYLEARIRELEHQLGHAVAVKRDEASLGGQAHLGSAVTVTNLVSSRTVQYTLVGQNEVDTAAGRISVVSPVGQALVGRSAGDVVAVEAPSGTIRFRVETVEG